MLPPLFELEDYVSCMGNKSSFCKLDAHLRNIDNESQSWKHIKDSYENEGFMDRSLLHRGFCIPSQNGKDLESIKLYSEMLVNKELGPFNLTSEVEVLGCYDSDHTLTLYDRIVMIILMVYSGLILFATIYSLIKTRVASEPQFISIFSVHRNWQKRIARKRNEDYEKLKSIEGIRFFSSLLVMVVHTKLSYGMVYLANPSMLEEVAAHPIWNIMTVFDVFVVKSYFMISAWLLTVQIFNILENSDRNFSLKQVATIIVNRYFRLAVSLCFLIAIFNTSAVIFYGGPLNIENILTHDKACRNNWMQSLLFINNFQFIIDVCNPLSWYLSADFQMYVFNTLAFYFIIKYRLNAFKTVGIMMAMASVLYGTIIYVYDMDIIYRSSVRNMEYRIFTKSLAFFISYQSTISIFGCCSVGVVLGLIYSTKKMEVKQNFLTTCVWFAAFFGLPLSVILISQQEYRGVSAAILGPLVNPMFVLGTGIGILGMSHGIGGIVKRVCESRFVEILGNFNYGIYLCQVLFCFVRPNEELLPIEVGYLKMVEDYLKLVGKSILVGIILTLTVEEPGMAIQKMILPQLTRTKGVKKETKEK